MNTYARACAALLVLCAAALLLPAGRADAAPFAYAKQGTARATWDASVAASRARGVTFGPWYYAGPFDHTDGRGFETAYPPEKGVALDAAYTGKGGRKVAWRKGDAFKDGETNSLRIFEENDWIAVYLYRTIQSDGAQELPVLFGSDDTITVWLNGEKLLANNANRACRLGDDSAALRLKPGRNELLLKVCQGGGPSGFAFGHDSVQSFETLLLQRIGQDFPPAEVQAFLVERDWFRQDGLDRPAADLRAAAGKALRLAQATLASVTPRAAQPDLARQLETLAGKHARAGADADWRSLYLETRSLRRRIALADPLLAFDRLLVAKRPPTTYSHMCDQYLGRHSRPGPGLVVLENWRERPVARPLLEGKLPAGAVLNPDLSFDGRSVLFAFCDHTVQPAGARRYHVYEAATDGSFVRPLTSGDYEEFDPCYLPLGGFLFLSLRDSGFGRCHGGRYTPSYTLYRANGDGSDAHRISFGEANEWNPSVLHDGRILYTRWDYINRHDTVFQSLWITRPDGSNTLHSYGNYTRNPCMTAEARAIPGSRKIVCTAMGHHSYTAGSIMVVDPEEGFDGDAPIRRVTPEVPFPETEGWPEGSFAGPWPLSEDLFLAAYSPDRLAHQGQVQRENAYGIYLVDTLGGRELIYRDPAVSCFSPIPLRARQRPPALPRVAAARQPEGTFYVLDVTRGTPALAAGSIKRMRVVQVYGQPTASVPARSVVENEVLKRILGTVPVNADGSAAFRAPAGVPLLFQMLDENGMAVMSMRSQAYLQPGETAGCVGCHEARNTTPPARIHSAGLRARAIEPAPGPAYEGGFSFARTVQPVLDRHCIGCHGLSKTEAGVNLVGTPQEGFSTAYLSLVQRPGLVSLAHRNQEKAYSTPRVYGAHAGRLAPLLLGAHRQRAPLDEASFTRIAGWLDLNCQYYGDYSPQRPERRRPSPESEKALRAQVQAQCGSCHAGRSGEPVDALVNIAQPDESRVLMAPLAKAAGGWGQCDRLWTDATTQGYREMRGAVGAAAGGWPAAPRLARK